MRELRFDGLSQDGSRLVLAGKDGQKYTVEIDERIEAAVRRDRARIGQVEIEQAGVLRPREIQARIRAGATAEDVAASSGLPLEHIRRFEGPVLTERAWVAEQAQATELRKPGGDIELGELVAERLAGEGVDAADIAWDAWRRDDGLWVVIATFPLGASTHVATWNYDSGSRTMTVADDNSRSLSSISTEEPLRLVAARPSLAPVASLGADDEPAAIIRGLPRAQSHDEDAAEDPDVGEGGDWREGPDQGVDEGMEEDPSTGPDDLDDEALSPTDPDAQTTDQGDGRDDADGGDPAAGSDTGTDAEDLDGASDPDAHEEPEPRQEEGDPGDPGVGPTADAEDVPLFDAPESSEPPRPGQRRAVPSFDDILFGPGQGN